MKLTLPPPNRKFRLQWRPNFIGPERRLCLTRVYWNRGTPGDGKGYSTKISVSLCWRWRLFFVGAFFPPQTSLDDTMLWLCLLPCLPIRIHLLRSWGGSFI